MFCIESQGPWNGSCSLKHLKEGGFLGHPASYNWYQFVEKSSNNRRTIVETSSNNRRNIVHKSKKLNKKSSKNHPKILPKSIPNRPKIEKQIASNRDFERRCPKMSPPNIGCAQEQLSVPAFLSLPFRSPFFNIFLYPPRPPKPLPKQFWTWAKSVCGSHHAHPRCSTIDVFQDCQASNDP